MTGTAPFDQRDGVIWFDGVLVPWREAQLHVLSHGLHYASSVFEGERVYGGQVFRLTEHSERLLASARELGFTIPFTSAELDAATRDVVHALGVRDGYVRPVAWRGSESIDISGQGATVHVAVAAWEWPHVFAPESQEKGVRLATARWRRPAPNTAPVRAKAAAVYAIGTLARQEATAAGFDDALLLDQQGYLAEATGANVFLVAGSELHTPVPDCFLAGITRRTIIDLAREWGITVLERHIRPEELRHADEVFLTGTAYEVQPVRTVDDTDFTVGEMCRRLGAAYTTLVHSAPVSTARGSVKDSPRTG